MARSTTKNGRPLTYTDEIGEEICRVIATNPKSVQKLCKEYAHWPCFQTIYEWRIKVPRFGEMYARAKECQIEVLVDEILEISDDTTNDIIIRTTKNGTEYEACNSEWINRSRLRVDSRKWLAAKLAPRLYGDKNTEEKSDDFISKHREKL